MRSEMENISEKMTEEGGQFPMLIPDSITWTPFLLITIFQYAFTNTMTCIENCHLEALIIF